MEGSWTFLVSEQAKSECDWVVMTSAFVASQSGFFLGAAGFNH
jgi:hypothetical protein